MKSFIIICFLVASLPILTRAQENAAAKKAVVLTGADKMASGFTYHVFEAPNHLFGYDILRDGKIIYHQVVPFSAPANAKNADMPGKKSIRAYNAVAADSFIKKEQAEKAAQLSIEKIRKNQLPGLNHDEIRKITVE